MIKEKFNITIRIELESKSLGEGTVVMEVSQEDAIIEDIVDMATSLVGVAPITIPAVMELEQAEMLDIKNLMTKRRGNPFLS